MHGFRLNKLLDAHVCDLIFAEIKHIKCGAPSVHTCLQKLGDTRHICVAQPLAAVVYLLVRTVCITDIATRVVVRLDFNSLVSTAIALVASPCAANVILVVTFCALASAIATTL